MATPEKATSLNVSLPESLKAFVEQQVADGGYMSASEFIRHLLRRALADRAQKERLESLLVEGLESGEPLDVAESYWRQRRQALRQGDD